MLLMPIKSQLAEDACLVPKQLLGTALTCAFLVHVKSQSSIVVCPVIFLFFIFCFLGHTMGLVDS